MRLYDSLAGRVGVGEITRCIATVGFFHGATVRATVSHFIALTSRAARRVSAVRASPPWQDAPANEAAFWPAQLLRAVLLAAPCIGLEQRNKLVVAVKLHLVVVLAEIGTRFAA